jgi:hypothetical protein
MLASPSTTKPRADELYAERRRVINGMRLMQPESEIFIDIDRPMTPALFECYNMFSLLADYDRRRIYRQQHRQTCSKDAVCVELRHLTSMSSRIARRSCTPRLNKLVSFKDSFCKKLTYKKRLMIDRGDHSAP